MIKEMSYLCLFVTLLISAEIANSAITVDIYPNGSDIETIYYGNLNKSVCNDYTIDSTSTATTAMQPGGVYPSIEFRGSNNASDPNYPEVSVDDCVATVNPLTTWGSGTAYVTTIINQTGNVFSFSFLTAGTDAFMYLPLNYVSGTAIQGTGTYQSKTLTDFGLSAGTIFPYTLTNGPVTDTVKIRIFGGPPPTNVSATAGIESASVNFNIVTGATSYTAVCTSTDGGLPGSATSSSAPISVNNLTAGKTYTCIVNATFGSDAGAPTQPSNAVVPTGNTPPPPPAPIPTLSEWAQFMMILSFIGITGWSYRRRIQ